MRYGRTSGAGQGLIAAAAALLCLLASLSIAAAEKASRKASPMPAKTRLVTFQTSPFPFDGEIPEKGVRFLDVVEGERKGHTTRYGTIYWQDKTYSDRRVLLALPRGFDPSKPILFVVFFHGNGATLDRDVRARQQVVRQVLDSGRNTVLVAPQFAVDAFDSSAGRFWEAGVFRSFLDEAAAELAQMAGGERYKAAFDAAPVVLAAYSGGYQPTAFSLHVGDVDDRVQGVILLDALYAEVDKFRAFMARKPDTFLVSVHTESTASLNQTLQKQMRDDNLAYLTRLPPKIAPGTVSFISVPLKFTPPYKQEKEDEPLTDEQKAANQRERDKAAGDLHKDFVTKSFVNDTLRVILARVPRPTIMKSPVPVTTAANPTQDPNYVSKMPRPRPKQAPVQAKPSPAQANVVSEPEAPRPRPPTARQD